MGPVIHDSSINGRCDSTELAFFESDSKTPE